jgi:hypothetical protein
MSIPFDPRLVLDREFVEKEEEKRRREKRELDSELLPLLHKLSKVTEGSQHRREYFKEQGLQRAENFYLFGTEKIKPRPDTKSNRDVYLFKDSILVPTYTDEETIFTYMVCPDKVDRNKRYNEFIDFLREQGKKGTL